MEKDFEKLNAKMEDLIGKLSVIKDYVTTIYDAISYCCENDKDATCIRPLVKQIKDDLNYAFEIASVLEIDIFNFKP